MTTAGGALIDPRVIFEKINLSSGMRVADFGCGRTGHFIFPASKIVGDSGTIYAVDIIKNILESIKSRSRAEGYNNVQTIWSDIESFGKTPIPAASLHVCFLTNVIHMTKDKSAVLKEMMRLLQKDGMAVVIEWNKNLGTIGPKEGEMMTPQTLRDLAEKVGLSFVDNFDLGSYHYCSIFKKL